MAVKQFFHDIDLVNVGQLVGARKQNLTTVEREALALMLGMDNEGLFVWDTTEKTGYTWNGVEFQPEAVAVEGDVIFKGLFDASLPLDDAGQPQVIEPVSGHQYIVTTAGVFDAGTSGVTLANAQQLEVGDIILFTSPTQAYAIQRNDTYATETLEGNVRLATQAEVNTGTEATEAVTPATLQGKLVAQKYVKQYDGVVNLTAGTPANVAHNLNLVNRDAFTINVMLGNSAISVDVDSVDANTLTLTSLVALNGVAVTVQGAEAA